MFYCPNIIPYINAGKFRELPPKVDTFGFGSSDPLCLPLTVEFPLCLRHTAKKLEHDVSDQHPGEISALAGAQQGHIQHHDGGRFFFRQQTLLV